MYIKIYISSYIQFPAHRITSLSIVTVLHSGSSWFSSHCKIYLVLWMSSIVWQFACLSSCHFHLFGCVSWWNPVAGLLWCWLLPQPYWLLGGTNMVACHYWTFWGVFWMLFSKCHQWGGKWSKKWLVSRIQCLILWKMNQHFWRNILYFSNFVCVSSATLLVFQLE